MKNLILIAIIGFGFWAYSTGQLESWWTQFEVADRPIKEISCGDLQTIANGQSMQNAFGASYRVIQVSNPKQVSRSASQLTCRSDALLDSGQEVRLTIKVFDRQDQRFYEFRSQ